MSSFTPSEWSLTARWIIPVAGDPVERGIVAIRAGRVTTVAKRGERAADLDLGEVAILPGLVNAHTHLDLSDCRGRIAPEADFTAWLRAVVRHRRERPPDAGEKAIQSGLVESLRFGTTLLGDIAGAGLSYTALAAANLRAVVFHELLGLSRSRAKQAWAEASAWLKEHPATSTCRPGFSPHAPYSVRASLFRLAGQAAARRGLPLAIHLAETQAELELLSKRRGPFVDFLKERGVWDPSGLVHGVEEILALLEGRSVPPPGGERRTPSLNKRNVILVHGNYLGDGSSIPSWASVVYCPRTHNAFGHRDYPVEKLLRAGVRVALGTDSLASNPDLDLLAEARFVHQRYPAIPGSSIIRMATLSGAEALGWDHETGRLAPGKSADLVVVALPDEGDEPHEQILNSSIPVRAVMFRGQWVHGGPA